MSRTRLLRYFALSLVFALALVLVGCSDDASSETSKATETETETEAVSTSESDATTESTETTSTPESDTTTTTNEGNAGNTSENSSSTTEVDTPSDSPSVQESPANDDGTTGSEDNTDSSNVVEVDFEPDPAANAGNTIDQATLDSWADNACAFLTIYPVSYVRAGGADDEPVHLELYDWAAACLRYVDPNSSLGQDLQYDPESVAAPLGYYEVASFVRGTEVTNTSTGGINVTVTIEATQQDWEHIATITESFFVQFNNDGLITNVISTD